MDSLYDTIQRTLSGERAQQLGNRIGTTPDQAQTAVRAALPTLVAALSNNAQRPEGASAILNALRKDHDGRILDEVDAYLRGERESDGEGILRHVLGDNRGRVEQGVSQFVKLDAKTIGQLLVVLGPLLMGVLGKMRKNNDVRDEDDLRKILRREERTTQRRDRDVSDILREVLRGKGTGQSEGSGCLSMLGPLLRGGQR